MSEQQYLYRLEDGTTDPYRRPTLYTLSFPIVRETAACYVIRLNGGDRDTFVLKDPNGKRFAYLSMDDARNSYLQRKLRQVRILAARHDAAQAFLHEVQAQIAGEEPESEMCMLAGRMVPLV
jgi:aminoglycoside phosphotransferase